MSGATRSPGAPSHRAATVWCFVAVCVATLLAYGRSFHNPFHFDDFPNIVHAEELREPSADSFLHYARTRLLPALTFLANYRLGAESTFGYHLVNFALHLLATLAVYLLVLALCRTPRLRHTWLAEQRLPLAVSAALVFACHPVQVQAVTYIVQRISAMVALFYVSSVLLYVGARNAQLDQDRRRAAVSYTGAALCALAAFLSKENSASLPFAILLTEWTFFPSSGTGRRLLRLAPFFALIIVIPLVWGVFGARYRPGEGLASRLNYAIHMLIFRARPVDQVSPLQYFFTECTVIPRYLRMVLLPWGFSIDHDVPVATGFSPSVAAGLAFLAVLLVFGIYALRHWPLLGFGIVWPYVTLSVESSFLPIQDPMVEHRMYLAMPGVAIALATAFAWLLVRWRMAALAGGAALAAGLCLLTLLRNEVWRTPVALWGDALARAPGKARVHANLGTALYHDGRKEEAVAEFCRALEIDPGYEPAQINLNAAVAEDVEAADGGEVELDIVQIGPGRAVAVAPGDPCEKFKANK